MGILSKLVAKSIKKTKPKLDPTSTSSRSAIIQAQKYKKMQTGLQKEFDKTKESYDKIKDKTSEKAQMMNNKLKSMKKKLEGKKQIPMPPQNKNTGGLATPTATQPGLKKLPTAVRNKMGYMYGGGMAKKKKVTNMDYRKGGLVIMIGTGKPMKNKKGK